MRQCMHWTWLGGISSPSLLTTLTPCSFCWGRSSVTYPCSTWSTMASCLSQPGQGSSKQRFTSNKSWVDTFRWVGGGHTTFVGFLNMGVHVFMYFYYFMSSFGPGVQKYLWWKRWNIFKFQWSYNLVMNVLDTWQQCNWSNLQHSSSMQLFQYSLSVTFPKNTAMSSSSMVPCSSSSSSTSISNPTSRRTREGRVMAFPTRMVLSKKLTKVHIRLTGNAQCDVFLFSVFHVNVSHFTTIVILLMPKTIQTSNEVFSCLLLEQ